MQISKSHTVNFHVSFGDILYLVVEVWNYAFNSIVTYVFAFELEFLIIFVNLNIPK